MVRVLLIEDEPEIARRLVDRMAASGIFVDHAADAETALAWENVPAYSAMIVDIGLPGINGVEFVRLWRARRNETPILILSARGNWEEKVGGLNAGADDYVVKPVRTEELVARIHALVRRAGGQCGDRLVAGDIALDPATKAVWLQGSPIVLTQTEYRLLQTFMHRAGQILSQAALHDQLYPLARDRDLNTIEVHVGRLRRKVGHQAIRTVRGLGYRLEV